MYLGDKENLEGIIEYLRGREAFSSDLTRLQVEDLIEEETHCRWGIIKRAYEAVYSEGDAMRPKACDDWIGVGWGSVSCRRG